VPLPEVRARGLSLDELACLARCNGAEVEVARAAGGLPSSRRFAMRSRAVHAPSAC
jgi:hypothetical protein